MWLGCMCKCPDWLLKPYTVSHDTSRDREIWKWIEREREREKKNEKTKTKVKPQPHERKKDEKTTIDIGP